MIHVRSSKKTLILAAVVSIMSLSVASTSQTNALTLSEYLNNTFNSQQNRNQDNNQSRPVAPQTTTPSRQNNQTQNIVEQVIPAPTTTQTPAQTAPVTPAAPAQTQTTAPAQTQAAPRATYIQPITKQAVVAPLDTSAAVARTANAQAVGDTSANGSPYVSNKLDPVVAQKLLFAGIATITAGTLLYAGSIFPFKKQVRHIPVKSL